ncbi:MAG: DUF2017 family protein [Gaiellaceae bacterium]
MLRRPLQPQPDGGYLLRLAAPERDAVRELCAELRPLVDTRDPSAARLFPEAYADDPHASAEFDRLTGDSLRDGRLAALDTVAATIDAERLDEAAAGAWCGVLNDARLVLGERLGVTDELYEKGIRPDDPRAPELAFYGWLTWLQGEVVEALSSRL